MPKKRKSRTRREYGSGSISINNKINRYTVTWTGNDGNRHSNSRFDLSPKGKQEAQKFLSEINSMKNDGIDIDEQAPLYEWLAQFLIYKKGTIKRTTLNRYKSSMLMIPDTLMEKPINAITESDLRAFYGELAECYTASTIHNLHSVLLGTFDLAIKERKLRYNIMLNIKRPRKQKKEIVVFSPREIGTIFQYIKKNEKANRDTCLLLFRILEGTGMRIGEALALQWKDINFESREIHVHRTMWPDGTIEQTKTEAGNRFIPIFSDKTLAMLKKTKATKQRCLFEIKNKPLNYPTTQMIWNKIKKETGINKKLHNWRHTFASYMLQRNVPIPEVSRMLGHSNPSITMQIYAHSIPNSNQQLLREYQSWSKQPN